MSVVQRKLANIRPSFRQVVLLWREEPSFRLQVCVGALTILLSYVLQLSRAEFLFVLLIIGAVLTTEALNTAIEELCDHVTPEHHPQIGKVKELGSGASGIIGVVAVVIGLIIFVPHVMALFL